jgi:BirA family biotin operon repressor/biotin-[acetyl-CoA-carboxylase] ligase
LYNISANTIFTGKTLVYLPTCHSTNDYARRLLTEENPLEGTLVITPEQTAGKGQRGNTWESQVGTNLTFSLIYKPSFLNLGDQFYLNIISSLAVRDTVAKFLQTDVKVKWPNDIYLNDKKISGILIQNTIKGHSLGYSVIGIGLNVNQEVFSDKKAISMKKYSSEEYSVEAVLNVLLENLDFYYMKLRNNGQDELYQGYKKHLYRFEEEHSFKAGEEIFVGKITDIDEPGRLIILSNGQLRVFSFKEVSFHD